MKYCDEHAIGFYADGGECPLCASSRDFDEVRER